MAGRSRQPDYHGPAAADGTARSRRCSSWGWSRTFMMS